jgi:hypothetical protein
MRGLGRRRHDDPIDDAYATWLVQQVYECVASWYPEDVLPRDRFLSLVNTYADPSWLKPSNRYIGDLWYLFAPDFTRRLDEYYRAQDFALTLTLLSYASNVPLLEANYRRPYRFARERLTRFTVLELGAGIPHGFLDLLRQEGTGFCDHLVAVDIDGLPARITACCCRRHEVSFAQMTAVAGAAPALATRPIDFVFAKDVFEHLTDPAAAVDQVLACASERAVLALDLDDKGPVVYQHVSPALEPLKSRVAAAGFMLAEHTGNMSIFVRRS